MAYETDRTWPGVLILVVAVMACVDALSSWGPVRRALHIDPAAALRTD
jgi:ABC-type lipoprotein release transport system permease subunit